MTSGRELVDEYPDGWGWDHMTRLQRIAYASAKRLVNWRIEAEEKGVDTGIPGRCRARISGREETWLLKYDMRRAERAGMEWTDALKYDDKWGPEGRPAGKWLRPSEYDDGTGRCARPAGYGTDHSGWGACSWHGGRGIRGGTEAAWIMGHELARELDVTPWQALMVAVRREAAEAAWYDSKISQVTNDEELRPGGDAYDWLRGSQLARDRMARYAKMAIDAGVAERLIRNEETSARLAAEAVIRALEGLEAVGVVLDSDARVAAIRAAQSFIIAAPALEG